MNVSLIFWYFFFDNMKNIVVVPLQLFLVIISGCKAPCKRTQHQLLANNSQHCWMLHVPSVCTPCCMLLDIVASCCAKFETAQTFQPTTPNISFVPWSPKRSATMLDPFAQLFQRCWGHARSLRMVYKDYGLYPSHDALQHCWELLNPFAHHWNGSKVSGEFDPCRM